MKTSVKHFELAVGP